MLTIREPIALKIQRPLQSIRQDMAERMQANYGLMRLPIRKEELLHITSEPPEVYFAEGDNVQLFTNIKNENQQEIRLDVINNLINRIMVSQTENFTYQDTVYISSVLRKLGIRDEKTFMKQVFQLQNAHKETHQLLKQYENNQEILQMLFTQEQEQRKAEGRQAEVPAATEQRYYIHDEIFRRLDTAKIYQDMRSFTKGLRHESQQIFRNEFSIGEQAAMVQNFHLHNLKQKIMQMETPLVYFHNNQYEFLQENLEEVNETLEERISAAILLNLTNQSYSLRQQQIEQNSHNWYSVAGALFQTAENTWKRYEANLTENKRISSQMTQVLEEVSEVKRKEGDMIQNIVQEFRTLNQDWQNSTELRQQIQQQNRMRQAITEEVNIGGGSYYLTQEELELQYLQQEEHEEEPKEPTAVTAEQLQKQLEIFNQKNYENYQKLTEIERQQPRVRERKLDRRRAQQDALRALENPGEVLMEFVTTEVHDPVLESQKQLETQIYELFSDETKEIYRQFLQQKPDQQTTFLQHIMTQPAESELRQEVVHAIERMQQQEVVERIERQIERQTEMMQPTVSQTINQEIRQQMISLQELQNSAVYEQWVQPAEIRWQKEVETETQVLQQMRTESAHLVTERERVLQKAEAEVSAMTEDIMEKQPMLHPSETVETEEIFTVKTEQTLLQQQEQQMLEIRQSIEKQIRRQELEKVAELAATQRELQFQRVDIIHKVEEQLVTDELMETIRTQQQNTRREEHKEETILHRDQINQTMMQNTINRTQLNQIENIDELVQQTVRKQMNHLSDQVYGKIEKKLATERKRRGY
ncbi:MAG: hypothetical protein IKC46_11865 [Lachnospiraceae bacterium]|nr:hypothetical protein [Lachnospiraceae bacterium]